MEGATRVGDIFWAHPAKPTRRGCTAFDRFWQRVASHHEHTYKNIWAKRQRIKQIAAENNERAWHVTIGMSPKSRPKLSFLHLKLFLILSMLWIVLRHKLLGEIERYIMYTDLKFLLCYHTLMQNYYCLQQMILLDIICHKTNFAIITYNICHIFLMFGMFLIKEILLSFGSKFPAHTTLARKSQRALYGATS